MVNFNYSYIFPEACYLHRWALDIRKIIHNVPGKETSKIFVKVEVKRVHWAQSVKNSSLLYSKCLWGVKGNEEVKGLLFLDQVFESLASVPSRVSTRFPIQETKCPFIWDFFTVKPMYGLHNYRAQKNVKVMGKGDKLRENVHWFFFHYLMLILIWHTLWQRPPLSHTYCSCGTITLKLSNGTDICWTSINIIHVLLNMRVHIHIHTHIHTHTHMYEVTLIDPNTVLSINFRSKENMNWCFT